MTVPIAARTRRAGLGAALIALAAGLCMPPPAAAAIQAQLLTLPDWQPSDGAVLSGDGRYVAYSAAKPGGVSQVYLLDRKTGKPDLVSVTSAGKPSGADSQAADVSADGRYVVFESLAKDLVPGATADPARAQLWDVFVRDRVARRTTRVSLDVRGQELSKTSRVGGISADGRTVLFGTMADVLHSGSIPSQDGGDGWYAVDRVTRRITPINRTPQQIFVRAEVGSQGMSATGRYVLFTTSARALPTDGDDTSDVYRMDTATGQVVLVSDVPVPPVTYAPPGVPQPVPYPGGILVDYTSASMNAAGNLVAFRELRTTQPTDSALTTAEVGGRVLVVNLAGPARVVHVPYARGFLPAPRPAVLGPRDTVGPTLLPATGTAVTFVVPAVNPVSVDDRYGATDPRQHPTLYRSAVATAPALTTLTAPVDCTTTCPPRCCIPTPYVINEVSANRDGSVVLVRTDLPLVAGDIDNAVDVYLITAPR